MGHEEPDSLLVVETAAGAGVELAYDASGEGPTVLLVNGMGGESPALERAREELGSRARVIAYDRRGYGRSQAPEPYERTTVQEQAEDAAALIGGLDAAPAILCGADFGALVCLDLALRHGAIVRGAVLIGPPLLWLVAGGSEELGAQRELLETALRDGGRRQAIEAWLGAEASAARVERTASSASAFFADWSGLSTWPATKRELRAIAAPLIVLDPERPSRAVAAAGDVLADVAPAARREPGTDAAAALRALLDA